MTQATDTDIRDIKTSIEANTKAIGDLTSSVSSLREEMRVGFSDINGKLDTINTRLTEVEKKTDKLDTKMDKLETKFDAKIDKSDNRLWAFVAIVLAASLGTIYKLVAFP